MNGHYDGFGFYHGPDDPRLIVPKRIPIMGWTVNLSHPQAPLLLLLTLLLGRKRRDSGNCHQCGGEKYGETFHEKFVRVFQTVPDGSEQSKLNPGCPAARQTRFSHSDSLKPTR